MKTSTNVFVAAPFRFMNLLPSDRPLWGAIALLAVIMIPWCSGVGVTVTGPAFVAVVTFSILVFRCVYAALRPQSNQVHVLLENAASFIAFCAVMGPISYLCARGAHPLVDASLRSVDTALGFNWDAWHRFDVRHPILTDIQMLAYDSFLLQAAAVILLLPITKGCAQGFTFIRTAFIAVSICCVVSRFSPAAMPQASHERWFADFQALRQVGAPFSFELKNIQGIITFPSFHAAMAIIFAYSMRGWTVIGIVFGLLNAVMVISTPIMGYHYLADVIAGIAVGAASIALCQPWDKAAPPQAA